MQNNNCFGKTPAAFYGEMLEPLVQEEKSDKRFADGDWEGNPVFNYIKQAYLLNAEYVSQMVESLEFEDGKMGEQVRFTLASWLTPWRRPIMYLPTRRCAGKY